MLFVMIGIVGLSIDWGWAAMDAHQLQNASDAAALAGAMVVKNAAHDGTLGSVYTSAQTLSLANKAANEVVDVSFDAAGNDPNLDVVLGRWFMADRHFEPLVFGSGAVPNAVKVVTRHEAGWSVNQPLALNFGPVFGVETTDVKREAIAISTGGGGAALVCLAPDERAWKSMVEARFASMTGRFRGRSGSIPLHAGRPTPSIRTPTARRTPQRLVDRL